MTEQPMTLVQHWDGDAWSVVPSPTVDGNGSLWAVDAAAPGDVWAVGSYVVPSTSEAAGRTLVVRWDGDAWQVVPSPNAGIEGGNGTLRGVDALAADDVWAVGSHFPDVDAPTLQPLIEHWDGTGWEIVPGPSRRAGPWSQLKAVSGTGPDDVWAVGVRDVRVGSAWTERGLILHWDGVAWTRVAAPLPAGRLSPFVLHDVVAVSPTRAWAVGAVADRTSHRTVVMRWNGRAWKVVRSANPSARYQDLAAVAADPAGRVWAVGTYYDPKARTMRTLVERWNGTRFRTVPSESRRGSELKDVAAVAGARFAVGERGQLPVRTLVLHAR